MPYAEVPSPHGKRVQVHMSQAATKMTSDIPTPDDLVHKYQRYVHSVASKLIASMHLPATSLDEFVSAGYLGLVEAAQRFDPQSGIDFKSFAFLRIRGAIIDNIRANSDLSGKAYRMARAWGASQEMEESIFFSGTTHETTKSDEMLAQVFEFAASGALAFKMSIADVEEEVSEIVCDDLSQEENLIEQERSVDLRKLVEKLPEKERLIVQGYYFDHLSFVEIAERHDGMTKSWVSRLHTRALSRLKKLYIEHGGDPREN